MHERLEAMKATFMEEAIANQVLPLDDRLAERRFAGGCRTTDHPELAELWSTWAGAKGLDEDAVINMKNIVRPSDRSRSGS